MKYLPFEDFEIHSALTPDEVFYKLRSAVDTPRKWWVFTNKPFWKGMVERHYFRISRVDWAAQNFPPVISGKIKTDSIGCCIQIKMRMSWLYTLILVGLWIIYFRSIADLIIQKVQTGIWQIESPWMLLPAIGMFSVFLFNVSWNFQTRSAQCQKIFTMVIRGRQGKCHIQRSNFRINGIPNRNICITFDNYCIARMDCI